MQNCEEGAGTPTHAHHHTPVAQNLGQPTSRKHPPSLHGAARMRLADLHSICSLAGLACHCCQKPKVVKHLAHALHLASCLEARKVDLRPAPLKFPLCQRPFQFIHAEPKKVSHDNSFALSTLMVKRHGKGNR